MVPACGLFLFLGPDRFRKQQRLAHFRQSLKVQPLDAHELNARQLTPAALGTLIREYPAASPARLVVVEEAHRLTPACLKVLEHHHAALKSVACVVLLSEAPLEPSHPLLALKPYAAVESFEEGRSKPSSAFAILEAVGRRDAAAALRAMQDQLAEGKEVVELLGLVGGLHLSILLCFMENFPPPPRFVLEKMLCCRNTF
jgi:DNA polymerase III delta subunit